MFALGVVAAVIVLSHRRHLFETYPQLKPNEIDERNAMEYAMSKICAAEGYASKYGRCVHTEVTCKRDNVNQNDALYAEWRNGKCMSTDLSFKNFCTSQGLQAVPDDSGVYTCLPTESYCKSKGVDWKDGDCFMNVGQRLFENVFGTTVTRGVRKGGEIAVNAIGKGVVTAVDKFKGLFG